MKNQLFVQHLWRRCYNGIRYNYQLRTFSTTGLAEVPKMSYKALPNSPVTLFLLNQDQQYKNQHKNQQSISEQTPIMNTQADTADFDSELTETNKIDPHTTWKHNRKWLGLVFLAWFLVAIVLLVQAAYTS